MKILLIGATGFVGAEVLKQLLLTNHEVSLLAHNDAADAKLRALYPALTVLRTDPSDLESSRKLLDSLKGIECIIYLPGLLREFPAKGITFQKVHVDGVRNLIRLAKELGIRRWLQMSALGVSNTATTEYYKTKWAAEELVRNSDLDWTIFRPSVIFGDEPTTRANFAGELAAVIKAAPVIPVFGDGNYRMQPIALKVVASAFVESISNAETIHKTFELGGPEKLCYTEIMQTIARAMGKEKPVVHIPFWPIELVAAILDRFSFFPVTRDQLTMLKLENIVRDPAKEEEFLQAFHPNRQTLAEGLQRYFASTIHP